MYNNKSDKILALMYPKLFRKYVETKGDKVDDKTFKRLRLILNSEYGVMSAKEWYEKED